MQTCDCVKNHADTCCGLLNRQEEVKWKKEHEMVKTTLMKCNSFVASFSKLQMKRVFLLTELFPVLVILIERIYFSTEKKNGSTCYTIEQELTSRAKPQMNLLSIRSL